LFFSCEEVKNEDQLNNCATVPLFLSINEEGNTVSDQEGVFLCGRSQEELQAKIDLAATGFTEAESIAKEIFKKEQEAAAAAAPIVLLNFDDLSVDFAGFNNASFNIVENPFLEGENAKASNVGQIVNTGISQFEGVASSAFDMNIDFSESSSKIIIVDVYSESSVPVDFQIKRNEMGSTSEDPRGTAKTLTHGGTGWEELEIDYNEGAIKSFDGLDGDGDSFVPEGLFNQIVILIDGPETAAGTYYFDNVRLKRKQN